MAISRLATVGLLALLAYANAARAEEGVADGAPISAEFARTLYGRIGPLREPDGCRLERFDTSRYRITIALVTPAGAQHFLDLATAQGLIPLSRTAGDWAIAVPACVTLNRSSPAVSRNSTCADCSGSSGAVNLACASCRADIGRPSQRSAAMSTQFQGGASCSRSS